MAEHHLGGWPDSVRWRCCWAVPDTITTNGSSLPRRLSHRPGSALCLVGPAASFQTDAPTLPQRGTPRDGPGPFLVQTPPIRSPQGWPGHSAAWPVGLPPFSSGGCSMKTAWYTLLALAAVALLAVGLRAQDNKKEVTLKGTILCAKCSLKEA